GAAGAVAGTTSTATATAAIPSRLSLPAHIPDTVSVLHRTVSMSARLADPKLDAGAADRDGEVQVLAAARDEHADDVALPVDRRAAGVAGVRRRVGLDRLLRHAADDAGRDGSLEAVGAADQEQLVAGPRRG